MPDNAVFISYAREDLPAVQQIKAGLEAAGITTWFDIDRLEVGDDYDRKIQRNIARCSYFIPVVSATTQRRLEGYFRREWSYAIDRARNMADGALFILPVTIDATTAAEALVPDKFKALHFTHLPGGEVPAGVRAAAGGLHACAPAMNALADNAAVVDAAAVDERNPWLGLASFTEETRRLFLRPRGGGRRARAARAAQAADGAVRPVGARQDLDPARRPRAAPARPGLLPDLRAHRLRARGARARRADQAGDRAHRARAPASGPRSGVAAEGESLWEFLHHRDDVLRDESGTTLIPLLIFDQFEEIFTLAQSDDFGRARAARFIADLADLVENRAAEGARGEGSRRTIRRPSASISRAATIAC